MLPAKGNIYCAEHLCFQEDQEVLGQLAAVDHLGALVYKQDRKLNNGRALLIKHWKAFALRSLEKILISISRVLLLLLLRIKIMKIIEKLMEKNKLWKLINLWKIYYNKFQSI